MEIFIALNALPRIRCGRERRKGDLRSISRARARTETRRSQLSASGIYNDDFFTGELRPPRTAFTFPPSHLAIVKRRVRRLRNFARMPVRLSPPRWRFPKRSFPRFPKRRSAISHSSHLSLNRISYLSFVRITYRAANEWTMLTM
jgi:hypothetical protein